MGLLKPTGIRRATPNPKAAITNIPVLLKATAATELNLRFLGQYDDAETGTFYNYQRQYLKPARGGIRRGIRLELKADLIDLGMRGAQRWWRPILKVYAGSTSKVLETCTDRTTTPAPLYLLVLATRARLARLTMAFWIQLARVLSRLATF
ncbi:MAG: hypothetical protein U1E71_06650 [Ramlibacter sp.]